MAVCACSSERPAFVAAHRGPGKERPWAGIAFAALLHAGVAAAALQGFDRLDAEPAPMVIDFVLPPPAPAAAAAEEPATPAEPETVAEAVAKPAAEPAAAAPLPVAMPEPKPAAAKPKRISHKAMSAPAPSSQPPSPASPETAASGMADAASAMPAAAAPVAAAPAKAEPAATPPASPYAAILRQWLARHEEYPRRARLRHQEGTVSLAIALDRSGRLLRLELAAPSAHEVLNQAALDMARSAAPYPPPPLAAGQDEAVFVVPFSYVLRER